MGGRLIAPVVLIALSVCGCAGQGPRPAPPPGSLLRAFRGHTHTVTGLALSGDGRWLASVSRDGTARLWSLARDGSATVLGRAQWLRSAWAVAISPDGRWVASGSDDPALSIWALADGTLRTVIDAHRDSIRALAWSTDGRLLASGGRDNVVWLWDSDAWTARGRLPHGDTVRALVFSPDGRWLFTGTAEDVIRAWDVRTHSLVRTLRGHTNTVHALGLSADGQTLISGGADQTLRLWSTRTLTPAAVLRLDRTREPPRRAERYGIVPGPEVLALAVTGDGRFVASAHRASAIRIWDLRGDGQVAAILSPAPTSYALGWAPDGRSLFSGGDDRVIYQWDVSNVTAAGGSDRREAR